MLFVFILCYAVYNPFGKDSPLTLTNVVGSIYLLAAILTFKSKINYSEIKPFVIPLLLLFIWITIMSIINISPNNEHCSAFNFGLFRNILLFILIFYDLKGDLKFQNKIINTYLFSIVSIAILAALNIEVTYHSTGRLLLFGTNANEVGLWCVFGICFIIDKAIFGNKSNSNRLLLLLLIPLLLSLIAKTGSRGAVVLLITSIIAFSFYLPGKFKTKLIIFFLLIVFVLSILLVVIQNEILADRFLSFFETGDTSGRGELWLNTFLIIKENPIFGFGETGYELRITNLIGEYMGTHNVFLYILVVGGVIGLFLFLLFLYRIYKSVMDNYHLNNQVLPIILFLIIFLLMMKGGGVLIDRVLWFILAYIASTTTCSDFIQRKDYEYENNGC